MDMGNKCDNNRHNTSMNDKNASASKSSSSSLSSVSGPSSPTPSISCETCTQLSQLEIEAFAAVREVATFVKSICVSEMLTRTPELLFLNLVTLENESYCIELTQKGWRICSDRLDCMYGDFRKLEMHIIYYETIYALLDSLSKLYRDSFSNSLAKKLEQVQDQRLATISETKTAEEFKFNEEEVKFNEDEVNCKLYEKVKEEVKEDKNDGFVYTSHITGNLKMKPNIEDEDD